MLTKKEFLNLYGKKSGKKICIKENSTNFAASELLQSIWTPCLRLFASFKDEIATNNNINPIQSELKTLNSHILWVIGSG
jgi:hypothetical protein